MTIKRRVDMPKWYILALESANALLVDRGREIERLRARNAEMLALLQAIADSNESLPRGLRDEIRAAIAKATGGKS